MGKKISLDELEAHDAADYLDTPEAIAAYVNAAFASGDRGIVLNALGKAVAAYANLAFDDNPEWTAEDFRKGRENVQKGGPLEHEAKRLVRRADQ